MKEAYIVAAVRTPVGKAFKGLLSKTRPEDLAVHCTLELLRRIPSLDPEIIDDLILGCAMPEAEQGMNAGRMVVLQAGLPDSVCGLTLNRYCSSGLQALSLAADSIVLGRAKAVLSGGMESMSLIPLGGHKITPHPELVKKRPLSYLTMGLTAERVAEKYHISRMRQDEFAYTSHQKAIKAQVEKKFISELVTTLPLQVDEGPRADTSPSVLAQLPPVFKNQGTVTAGNSSQVSDGAALALLMDEKTVNQLGVKPLARWVSFAVAGCSPELMGMGPIYAIPKVLKQADWTPDSIDLWELNEAFAAQALAVMDVLKLPPDKVNVNGGAIALGHPLGCTGTKLAVQLIYELQKRGLKRGCVSMCIGGGMGAAGLLEVIP